MQKYELLGQYVATFDQVEAERVRTVATISQSMDHFRELFESFFGYQPHVISDNRLLSAYANFNLVEEIVDLDPDQDPNPTFH